MAQITQGFRSILSFPWVYNLWSYLLGAAEARADFIKTYLKISEGDKVLDIGCGTGAMFEALPPGINYTGFDLSESYIQQAIEKHGDSARFVHASVGESPDLPEGEFDVALATGVLHHLDDSEAVELFRLAAKSLRPGGRLITSDPVFIEGQSRVAKFIISRDRGQNVRRKEEYLELAETVFDSVDVDIRHDRIRIPYTHILLTSSNGE